MMILTYPNAKFYVVINLDANEIIMTVHRLMHKIGLYRSIVINIERFHDSSNGENKYTIVILTSREHLTAKRISTLFSDLKSKKGSAIYGKGQKRQ